MQWFYSEAFQDERVITKIERGLGREIGSLSDSLIAAHPFRLLREMSYPPVDAALFETMNLSASPE